MRFGGKGAYAADEEIKIDVTPLIDMMFQFLVFFMMTTTFATNAGFEVQLPRSSTAERQMEARDIIVAIDANRQVLYNQELVSDQALEGILEQEHAKRPDVTVIVQGDTGVPHGRVIEVMDLIRKAGFHKLAVATISQ